MTLNTGRNLLLAFVALMLSACASEPLNPNYAAQLNAYALAERAQADIAQARVDIETTRALALADIARSATDPNTKSLAVFALAMAGKDGAASAPAQRAALPMAPESQGDKAYKWAAMLAAPIMGITQGYYGYKLGTTQSNNAAATTIAGYSAFSDIAGAGFAANSALGNAGFGAASNIAGLIQAPAPNITLSGTGVIGSGSYSAPITTTTTTNETTTTLTNSQNPFTCYTRTGYLYGC
jgi:hypothetical protein